MNMSRLLLFVVSLLLSAFHPAGNAQPSADQQPEISTTTGSVWLIIHKGWAEDAALEKIEMKDMTQCEIQGALWKGSTTIGKKIVSKYQGFHCVEGK
tara:strand:+ start:241 stop:531 length:291 start_codon:yes stop_codon:yes gene_type:complete